ncbi:MAG: type II secretion system major pseudopilin GspG [Fimbriimonas ginsengisoli]|uniref:Type II secretion system core protein G n=1 Tax=Fimbriimonas ginsengisoli TaxID=1005039 RepID=A0A931LVN5_FIMGI|nr:type II secretion system major pseudopilin GspG [Fimbriimonas ginsengisoli]MBI3721279.1 type II secretion system major pseudopilin GspG [Fimbriimonas ginsengisoli]
MTFRVRRAFTLIELMVVIIIIAILAALVVPRVVGRASQAKVAAAKADISTFHTLLEHFRLDNDRYPTTQEGLQALRTAPSDAKNWKGPYMDHDLHPDPWGYDYHYEYPGPNGKDSFTLLSYGSDGAPGGDGDAADILDE